MKSGEPFNPYGLFHFAPIPDWLCRRKEINSSSKLVYGKLTQHCGRSGMVYPAQKTLADELGMSVQNVRLCLTHLTDKDLIQVQRPTGKERLDHLNNSYVFLWQDDMAPSLQDSSNTHYQPASSAGCQRASSRSIVKEIPIKNIPSPAGSGSECEAKHSRWKRFAEHLATSIGEVRKGNYKSKIPTWAKSFYATHKLDGKEIKRINLALTWYCERMSTHLGIDKHFLVILSGASFREKFDRLELAMGRERTNATDDNGEPSAEENMPAGRLVFSGKTVQGDFEDSE